MAWDKLEFDTRINQALERCGKNRELLAEALDRSPSVISDWTSPKRTSTPAPHQLLKMAEFLNVDPAWLAFGIGPTDESEREILNAIRRFDPRQDKEIKKLIDALPMTRTHLDIQIDHDAVPGTRLTALETRARETEPAYGKPEARPKPINRRDELKTFHLSNNASHDAVPIPKWLNLAAGPGGELELCEDYLYFRELRDWKGVHSAVIRGDSMLDTLRHDDLVLMREFETGKYELAQIDSKAEKVTLKDWQRESKIFHDDICVLSINDEPPTLKRVKYDTRRGALHWKMRINADNPAAWGEPWQVETGDQIIFYAKLVGIGEGKYTKR